MKVHGLIVEVYLKLLGLSIGGECGIFGVEVKFVEIGRNIGGEGDTLDEY